MRRSQRFGRHRFGRLLLVCRSEASNLLHRRRLVPSRLSNGRARPSSHGGQLRHEAGQHAAGLGKHGCSTSGIIHERGCGKWIHMFMACLGGALCGLVTRVTKCHPSLAHYMTMGRMCRVMWSASQERNLNALFTSGSSASSPCTAAVPEPSPSVGPKNPFAEAPSETLKLTI